MSFLGLKPTFFKNGTSFSLHSSYLQRNIHDGTDETAHFQRIKVYKRAARALGTNKPCSWRSTSLKTFAPTVISSVGDTDFQAIEKHAFKPPSPLQAPVHSGVVHFVHEDDQVFDSCRFGQHGVLSRLASFLEPRLELAFTRRNHLRDISEPSLKCLR